MGITTEFIRFFFIGLSFKLAVKNIRDVLSETRPFKTARGAELPGRKGPHHA